MEPPQAREIDLARRLIGGDESAFAPFVESIRQKVFQYTLLMCGHREDAEEVSQDTLMKVFQSFDQLKEPDRVRPWIFRIAKNYCLMKRRKSVYAPDHELSLDELMPNFGNNDSAGRKLEIADWSRLPEDQVLQRELAQHLRDALAELPDIYRSVVLLRDVEGLSTSETAEVLELSLDTVKQRLHRGRLALRKSMDSYLQRLQKEQVA